MNTISHAEIREEVAQLTLDRLKWKPVRFDQMAQNITDRVDNPAEAGVDRYVGLEHLDPQSLKLARWGSPTDVEATKLRFKPRDIIFGKRRAYQRKLAVAEFEGICSAHAMVLRAREEMVLPDYLPVFMQSECFFETALRISVGGLSPTINWRDLARQEFMLPPKDDQRRIADLLWAVESAKVARQETVGDCLALRAAQIGEFARGFAREHKLGQLADAITPGRPITYGILKPGLGVPGGVPVIKVRDYPNGYIEESSLLLTDPKIDHEYRRSKLEAGDLLISIRGTVGRIAEVPASLDGANITQDTARLSISPDHNRLYVRCLLESDFVQDQIRRKITGLAVQGINIGELRTIELPLPDLAIQKSIVERQTAIERSLAALSFDLSAITALRAALNGACFGAIF